MQAHWREGNRFVLLPEGQRYLPVLFEAIDQANHSILLELYAFDEGELAERFITALTRAAERGVIVLLLLDGAGAWGMSSQSQQRLLNAGVALRYFNPLTAKRLLSVKRLTSLKRLRTSISRDHRKILIIDGQVAFTGGFGAMDYFLNGWFEVAVRIEGPCVNDWIALFHSVWASRLSQGSGDPALMQRVINHMRDTAVESHMNGRVIWGGGYRYQAIRRSLHHRINTAQRRVWLCTPYFAPTLSLRRLLVRAARRGVDVRLLLPSDVHHDHPTVRYAGQRFYARLLRGGVRIYEYQPDFIHAKFAICDDWSTVGSCNFDHWSLQWNLEANQEVENAEFSHELAMIFERNFAKSYEISSLVWEQRPYWQRIREWCFGTLDALITRLR
ncbi:phospholipase D-like domain-containing protein [Phytohalomonas tamaricis]|uniref:phospholipase D-like domain-containing protein n=1 Tax=Phytohalomonas tamaricis TaxID=2081032 RepID=UPI000D0B7689|nr:phosphatidylserine/phosphatidylglycerophosphate/cardiolipin synthase family protein [Phytohalomonas tamaricis]